MKYSRIDVRNVGNRQQVCNWVRRGLQKRKESDRGEEYNEVEHPLIQTR